MALGAFLFNGGFVIAQQAQSAVTERLNAAIAELRERGAKPTANDIPRPVKNPPQAVSIAGPEFVDAWREYQRTISMMESVDGPTGRQPRINIAAGDSFEEVNKRASDYRKLVDSLLEGDKPATPEQIEPYVFELGGLCGSLGVNFDGPHEQAVVLAYLRHRRFAEALKRVMIYPLPTDIRANLLTALGFDWRNVVAGAWLDGRNGMLESLCQDGSEKAAQLALRWSELHWEEEVAWYETYRRGTSPPRLKPKLPTDELLILLRSGNSVSDPTKGRIAAFLNANAVRLKNLKSWLTGLPPGAAGWMRPLARAALENEDATVREMGTKVLNDARSFDAREQARPLPR